MRTFAKNVPIGRLLQWVAAARSTDCTRQGILGVWAEDGILVGTDGRRLHVAYGESDIKEGNYQYAETKTDVLLTPTEDSFPEWQRVMPEAKGTPLTYTAYPNTKKDMQLFSAKVGELLIDSGVLLNFAYLSDMVGKGESATEWNAYVDKEPNKAVLFSSMDKWCTADRKVVIMPMQLSVK